MKKAYIIPEIQIYDADAEEILAGSVDNDAVSESPDGILDDNIRSEVYSEGGALAKPGDFFCDNFEYELDF